MKAGQAFAENAFSPIGYLSTGVQAVDVVCKKGSGGSNLVGSFLGGLASDSLVDLLPPNIAWPYQCAAGAGGYIAQELLGGLFAGAFNWASSLDPNDIIGPESYGAQDFIWRREPFVFKIRFENIENASAPAQVVKVSSKIHENFDLRTVRLISFGFNSFSMRFDESSRSSYFSEAVAYDDELLPSFVQDQYEIRVLGTVDLTKREIFWQFRTIDVLTGLTYKFLFYILCITY